jgi:hypothetical protein
MTLSVCHVYATALTLGFFPCGQLLLLLHPGGEPLTWEWLLYLATVAIVPVESTAFAAW